MKTFWIQKPARQHVLQVRRLRPLGDRPRCRHPGSPDLICTVQPGIAPVLSRDLELRHADCKGARRELRRSISSPLSASGVLVRFC